MASMGAEKQGPAAIVQSAEKTGPITRENRHAGNRALIEAAKVVPDRAPIDQAVMMASMGAEKRGSAAIVRSAEKTGSIRARENGRAGNRALIEAAKAVPDRAPVDQAVMIASMGAEKRGSARLVQSAEDRPNDAGERPRWKSNADRSGEDRRGEQREERPRWKTSPERGTGRRDRIPAGMETISARRPRRSPEEKAPNETNAVLTGSADRKKAAATAMGRSRLRSAFSVVKTAARKTGARAADAKPKCPPQKAKARAGGRSIQRGVRRGRREEPRAPARAESQGSSRSAGTRTVQSVACAREERAASPSSPAPVRRKGRAQAPRANRDRKAVRKPRENRWRALSRAVHSRAFRPGDAPYIRPGPRIPFQYSRAWRERLQHRGHARARPFRGLRRARS